MAFLEMYLDESYGKPRPDIVIGGFVSRIDRWTRFAQLWRRDITERYNVRFVHMKDLWNPKAAAYRHLGREQPDEIFLAARTLIRDHVEVGIACVINQDDFNAVSTPSQRGVFGTAYTVGVRYCVTVIADYFRSLPDASVSVFLEDGHRNTNQVMDLLKQARQGQEQAYDSILRDKERFIVWRDPERDSLGIKLGVIDTGTKSDKAPLQAADLLAFSVLNEQDARFRDTLIEFGSEFPLVISHLSRAGLEETFRVLDEEEDERRRQRRRFASVIREMKNSNRDVKKHGPGGYFVNFNDLAGAESRVINRFGEGKLTRLLDQGDTAKPPSIDIEIDVQCSNCKTLFTLRGFSRHQSFGCPICEERIPFPEAERQTKGTIDQ